MLVDLDPEIVVFLSDTHGNNRGAPDLRQLQAVRQSLHVVADRRQRIDHRIDALVLEILQSKQDRVVSLHFFHAGDVLAHEHLTRGADLHTDDLAVQVLRLGDCDALRLRRADTSVIITIAEADLFLALLGPGQAREQRIDTAGFERGDDALEVDFLPLDFHFHPFGDLVGKIDVITDGLAVHDILERRIGRRSPEGDGARPLDLLQGRLRGRGASP